MINRNTFSKYALVTLLASVATAPTLAQAGACAGTQVPWTSTSNTFGNLQCEQLASRGQSFGQLNSLPGSPAIPFRLNVQLTKGIHAYAIAYNSVGTQLVNCSPFDGSTGDGAKFVEGAGCLSGSKHQVVVVF